MKKMSYQKRFNGNVHDLGRVAVLFGGFSAEREVSLNSGNAVLNGLKEVGVDAFGVDLKRDAITQLQSIKCDHAFIVLHGVGGEDGKIQALLEWLNIPYTGSDFASSALALNKLKTKLVWKSAGLPTPEFEVLSTESDMQNVLTSLGGECFVKPVREGSSLGMKCVKSVEALAEAFSFASEFDSEIIAEKRIVGKEFSVAILNGVALPSIELRAKNEFYDYDAKYVTGDTEYICPSELSDEKEREIRQLALKAFDLLGCSVWGRIDFMQDAEGNFYMLEANTVPGMTKTSLVPMAAKAAGLTFNELLCEVLGSTEG